MEHILACPKCNRPNRFGERVCGFCGGNLAHKCARCQVDIDPGMAYCPCCGETSTARPIEQSPANSDPSKNPDVVLEFS